MSAMAGVKICSNFAFSLFNVPLSAFQEFYEVGKRAADKVVSCVKRKEKFQFCVNMNASGRVEQPLQAIAYIIIILIEESRAGTIRQGQ